MQHRLVIAGALPKGSIPSVRGVNVEDRNNCITFTADRSEDMQRLKRLLAFSLADMITHEYEEKSLSDYIEETHPYFLPTERQAVLRSACQAAKKTPPERRTHYIENRLYEFLTQSEVLSLDGFVHFRLKEYKTLLKNTAAKAADLYLAEKEYEEFITLLKLFIVSQPHREPTVHVLMLADGTFRLLDKDGASLRDRYAHLFTSRDAAALEPEDLLLSALITLAPVEITFHRPQHLQNMRLLETVVRVFSGRVHVCESCPLCKAPE